MFPKSEKELPMNAATATDYVRRMVELETRGNGDVDEALRRLEAHFGLPYWPMWYLRKGKAKTIKTELFVKVRGAYLSYCERKIKVLQDELASEKAIYPNADLADLEADASKLATKVAQARLTLRGGRS